MELYIKVYLQVASRPAEFLKKHGNIRKVSELYGIGLVSGLPSTEKCYHYSLKVRQKQISKIYLFNFACFFPFLSNIFFGILDLHVVTCKLI